MIDIDAATIVATVKHMEARRNLTTSFDPLNSVRCSYGATRCRKTAVTISVVSDIPLPFDTRALGAHDSRNLSHRSLLSFDYQASNANARPTIASAKLAPPSTPMSHALDTSSIMLNIFGIGIGRSFFLLY